MDTTQRPEGDGFSNILIYPKRHVLYRALALHGLVFAALGAITLASLLSDDRHNQFYVISGIAALFVLSRLVPALRQVVTRTAQVVIDAEGLHMVATPPLFWPWTRIAGARQVEGTVIVDLRPFAGIDQGVRDRREVDLQAGRLDCDAAEVIRVIETGVARFSGAKS